MAEGVLQFAHQRGELLLVLVRLLVQRPLGDADGALQARPEAAQAAADFARPIGRPLPRQVQSVEVVRLDQRVGAVDERHAAGAALQQRIVALRRRLLVGDAIGVAAHRQQELEVREALAQRGNETEVALAAVQVQIGVHRFQLVGGTVDGRMAVDEMRAEVQRIAEIVETELAEAFSGWGERVREFDVELLAGGFLFGFYSVHWMRNVFELCQSI